MAGKGTPTKAALRRAGSSAIENKFAQLDDSIRLIGNNPEYLLRRAAEELIRGDHEFGIILALAAVAKDGPKKDSGR